MQGVRVLNQGAAVLRRHVSASCQQSVVCSHQQASYSTSPAANPANGYKFVVVGGGAGGTAMASWLARKQGKGNVAVIEPADTHYYQPLWTLVGGGIKPKEESSKPMGDVLPSGCDWIQDKVTGFNPENNTVKLSTGKDVQYDYLVVAMGIQMNFSQVCMPPGNGYAGGGGYGGKDVQYDYLVVAMGIQMNFSQLKGLEEALENDPMVTCNYSYQTVDKTFKAFNNFKKGNAIFTIPSTPIKCAGAPQKIMYLFEDYTRKNNKRADANIIYNSPLPAIFSAPKYAANLMELCKERGIEVNLKTNLVEIKSDKKEAVFAKVGTEPLETFTMPYEMMHVPPPMGPLDVIKSSPLAGQSGYVAVNKETGQHTKYPNVFAIGDCSDIPTSKTAAAIAGQSKALRQTMTAVLNGLTPNSKYDGYTSCPLVTGYDSCIMAEFDFKLEPLETFPFDQGKERKSMMHVKRDILPHIYWNGLLKGIWGGPGFYRKVMHLGMSK